LIDCSAGQYYTQVLLKRYKY